MESPATLRPGARSKNCRLNAIVLEEASLLSLFSLAGRTKEAEVVAIAILKRFSVRSPISGQGALNHIYKMRTLTGMLGL